MTTKAKTKRVRVQVTKAREVDFLISSDIVLSGYTGSIAKLKRLLEIAALDEEELIEQVAKEMFYAIINITKWEAEHGLHAVYRARAYAVIEALGLSVRGRRTSK